MIAYIWCNFSLLQWHHGGHCTPPVRGQTDLTGRWSYTLLSLISCIQPRFHTPSPYPLPALVFMGIVTIINQLDATHISSVMKWIISHMCHRILWRHRSSGWMSCFALRSCEPTRNPGMQVTVHMLSLSRVTPKYTILYHFHFIWSLLCIVTCCCKCFYAPHNKLSGHKL